ncbi:DUF2851 family protein [Candidatus Dependentiae bacterium]|nr:DUF2851 family protein [Candidatus Dependentiae bacterium]
METKIKEELLYFIWEKELFKKDNLKTIDNDEIVIINKGIRNHESGPDFHSAELLINNRYRKGHLEFHRKTSDWFLHKHNFNKAYDSVILHISIDPDTKLKDTGGYDIPQMNLIDFLFIDIDILWKYYLTLQTSKLKPIQDCKLSRYSNLDKTAIDDLKDIAIKYFYRNIRCIEKEFKIFTPEQVLFAGICKTLGYSRNTHLFSLLAAEININELLNIIQNLNYENACSFTINFFNQVLSSSKLIKDNKIKLFKVRPNNYFESRLIALANILAKLRRTSLKRGFELIILNEYSNNSNILQKLLSLSRFNNKFNPGKSRWIEILGNFLIPYYFILSGRVNRKRLFELFFTLPFGENISLIKTFNIFNLKESRYFYLKFAALKTVRNICQKDNYANCPFHVF